MKSALVLVAIALPGSLAVGVAALILFHAAAAVYGAARARF